MTGEEYVRRLRVLADAAEEAGLPHLTRVLRDDSTFNEDPVLRQSLREGDILHWPTLRWLISNGEAERGSGRTTMLMLAAIAEADSRVGEWISVVDHFPGPNENERTASALREVLKAVSKGAALGTEKNDRWTVTSAHWRWRNKQFEMRSGLENRRVVQLRRVR